LLRALIRPAGLTRVPLPPRTSRGERAGVANERYSVGR
jgi:hypothetical protein